jgi:hypothetical protein
VWATANIYLFGTCISMQLTASLSLQAVLVG